MLTEYIRAAMRQARYKILEDGESFYGEVTDFEGLWANATGLEDYREELGEVLEGWIVLSLSKNFPLPIIDGLSLEVSSMV